MISIARTPFHTFLLNLGYQRAPLEGPLVDAGREGPTDVACIRQPFIIAYLVRFFASFLAKKLGTLERSKGLRSVRWF